MARKRKFSRPKKSKRRRFRLTCSNSGESDEDYVAEEEEKEESLEEESCSESGEESEESFDFDNISDESEDEVRKTVLRSKSKRTIRGRIKSSANKSSCKKVGVSIEDDDEGSFDFIQSSDYEQEFDKPVVRPKSVRIFSGRNKSEVVNKSRKKNKTYIDADDEESFDFECTSDDIDEEVERPVRSKPTRQFSDKAKSVSKASNEKIISSKELGLYDDDDDDDEDDEDDDEFVPDMYDVDDEEDGWRVVKKTYVQKSKKGRKGSSDWKKKRQNFVNKRTGREIGQKETALKKVKEKSDGDFLFDNKKVSHNNQIIKRKRSSLRRKIESSDDDFVIEKNSRKCKRRSIVISDSDLVVTSDGDFMLSELDEGSIHGNGHTSLPSTVLSVRRETNDTLNEKSLRSLGRKGKEKVLESGKQVCGICLSKERIGTVRGRLNCCFHYFCFPCIMEWSKVESRCPICKQRFTTICKPSRSSIVINPREEVIKVPKRDQVYHPSEEEWRSYLDPYENVVCMECHQGEDDDLMLLCDICDSSAHTYCVGLGREVPEGNWYCEGCRPSESRPKTLNLFDNSFPLEVSNFTSSFTQQSVSVPQSSIPFQEQSPSDSFMAYFSPRSSIGESPQASTSISAFGASTLSGRRRIHRRIHILLSNNRMSPRLETGGPDNEVSNSIFGERSRISRTLENVVDLNEPPPLDENDFLFGYKETIPSTFDDLRSGVSESTNVLFDNGPLQAQPMHACSSLSQMEGAKEHLKSLVTRHLKILLRDANLDRSIFKEVTRNSTHSILAACGIKHNKTFAALIPAPSECSHLKEGSELSNLMKNICSSCFESFARDVVLHFINLQLKPGISEA